MFVQDEGTEQMKKLVLVVAAIVLSNGAQAADLTLNDVPTILQKLRGCTESKGVFGNSMSCRVEKSDLSVNVESDGRLLLMQRRSYGDTLFARGATVTDLLQNYAQKLNESRANEKATLDALAQFLPTQ